MKTKNVMQKLLVLLILTLAGSNIAQAVTYTFHIVNKSDGTDIVTGTWDRLDLPSEIKSPMCDFRYYNSAINAKNDDGTTGLITSAPGVDQHIYVAYTVKSTYTKYFSTAGNEHWYNAHCNGNYVKASSTNTGGYEVSSGDGTSSFNKYTDQSYMWTLVGDPYQASLCVRTLGISEPLVRTSDNATTLRFSSTVTDKKFIVLDAGSGGFSFRYATEASGSNGDFINKGNPFVIWNTSLSSGRTNSGNRWTFVELQIPVNVTYHLISNTGYEGFSLQTQAVAGGAPNLPNRDKLNTRLECSIGTTYYSDAACETPITSITESTTDIYVKYTFEAATLKEHTGIEFSDSYENAKWMTLRFNADNTKYLQYSNGKIVKGGTTPNADSYDFAFIGDPFKFRIVNKAAGSTMDVQDGGSSGDRTKYVNLTNGSDNRQWALLPSTSGTSMFNIMLASSYADTQKFYWNNTNTIQMYDNQDSGSHMLATTVAGVPTVTFDQTSYTTSKGTNVTITATATLNGGTAITNIAIERKNNDGTWTAVAQATNATTVSYTVDASEYGSATFRAVAITDGRTELSGTSDEVTVTVQYPDVAGESFTMKLIDKSGAVLNTWSITKTDVSNTYGEPLPEEWRSPLATDFKYYATSAAAKANSGTEIDWTTYTGTDVFVGYTPITNSSDPNYIDLNPAVTDISKRQRRIADDAKSPLVRAAGDFTTMYMLKFLDGTPDYLEDGNDAPETTTKTPVYPYANGDGQMYIYDDARYQAQKQNGASTRTRWPWYLLSPKQDPYHVLVTSWQQSHTDTTTNTNYYNFLRTYNQSGVGIITTTVSDDPRVASDNNNAVPTEYMLLGTKGAYKLVTSGEVAGATDATYGAHQAVNTFENYWKNNPTVQGIAEANPDANNPDLAAKGWHRFEAWANSAAWGDDNKTKSFKKDNHWYKTFNMGDGTFDLEVTEIDAVLVLLDKHGWEVMRHNIVKHVENDYADVQASLRKFDSPMVKEYKFYATKNVDHKVTGYHKYNVGNGTKDALGDKDLVNDGITRTSLAQYPEKFSGGALFDLYVTYDVKAEYLSSYEPKATEEGEASKFLLRQGSTFAKADGTGITGTTADQADHWYLKPNFEIDTEMGYGYDVDRDGLKDGTIIDKNATNTLYYNKGLSGFDPYNLRIQNVNSPNYYLTTNAQSATLDGQSWSGDGTTLSLTDATSTFDATGFDDVTCKVTNATFMAVQDANGNIRLMPRFQQDKVVSGFTTLDAPAAAQPAGDSSHGQSTLFSMPLTFKIVDLSGNIVISEDERTNVGLVLPRRLQSPFAENYTFHSSQEHASNAATRNTSNVTSETLPQDGIVYVAYSVKSNFGNGNDWNIFTAGANGNYMHPVYQAHGNGSSKERDYTNSSGGWWKLAAFHRDFANWNTKNITTSNFPFLDTGYAWQFAGENPDPYNALLRNKGTGMYIIHFTPTGSTNRQTDYMTSDDSKDGLDRYALLYYNDNETSENVAFLNRNNSKFVVCQTNDDRRFQSEYELANRSSATPMVVTQLPQISINVVNAAGEVEVTLPGFYKSGCTWTNSTAGTVDNTPFYLDRAYAEGHTFYYDAECTDIVANGEVVDDSKVLDNNAVYVRYTLDEDKWGKLHTADEYSTDFKLPDNDYLYWYAMRPQAEDGYRFKASEITTPTTVVGGGTSSTYSDPIANDQASRLSQWSFRGTPYNLHIINRYHGEDALVGVSKTAQPLDVASIYGNNYDHDAVSTTWEFTASLTTSSNGLTPCLYIRPQKALSGEAPLLYLSVESNKICMTNFLKGVQLKYVGKAEATSITFKLYDRQGNYMNADGYTSTKVKDYKVTGIATGETMENVFQNSPQKRRYCEYKFYSDAECTTEVTTTDFTSGKAQTVYVKWDYTDDAPVFSTAGTDKRDYQYYMMGVGGGTTDNGYSLMDVEGNGTAESPYTFKPNNGVGTPRDTKHQFAIVGNPYGFKLYNRAADKDIRRNKNLEITFADEETDGTATEEITFDMPVVSGAEYTNTECHFRSTLTGRYLNITGSNGDSKFAMGDGAGRKTRFRYLIVPLHVFYEENTTLAAQKDYRMYGLEMNPNNTARQTTDRFNTDAMRASDNKIGLAFDFNHAFCDYTFYRSYDWTTGALSDAIPEGGLSYYGGKIQTKRQFFATYTVDWDQFGKLYLIAQPANDYPGDETQAKPFLGKGNKNADVDGYSLKSENSSVTTVRADNEGTYRFKFIGDPYDMQIINIGTKDDDMVLGAKCTTYVGTSEIGQGLMTLNKHETYSKMSHFEIIQRSNGNHVFYLLDDENGRFFSSLHPSNNNIQNLIAYTINDEAQTLSVQKQMDRIKEFLIIPAIPQHSVTWNIVDANHQIVATKVVANAEEGTEFTLDDLPETLKRHYCDYNNMYSDQGCTEQYTDNKVTLGSEGINIYVPYELNSGAPNFVTEVPGTESADDKYWYETAFPHAETFVYGMSDNSVQNATISNGVESLRKNEYCPTGTTWQNFRWALIGTPYGVQLYNRATSKYLCIDGGQVKLDDTATTFDLMDDWQNELCAIYDKNSKSYIYRSQGNVVTTAFNNIFTSVEFSNQDGLTTFDFRLHYSGDTQRLNGVGGSSMKETIENIHIISFQKKGKKLIDVLPEYWKRAFCNYKFYWNDATTDESYTAGSEVTTITDDMVTKSQQNENNSIYIHITYTVDSPFEWSSQDEQSPEYHWYYLVNNHRPGNEQGKMVFRSADPDLRVSEGLIESKLYLSNHEWCVIGDPYGFKLLNRYDPDKRFDEYILASTGEKDVNMKASD